MEHDLGPALRIVFGVFAAFWVVVLAVLFIAIGPLTKMSERGTGGHGPGAGH